MYAITFKDTLRAIREENASRFPDDSFVVQFLDRWLKASVDPELWDEIADDAEKLILERARVFRVIVTIACDGLGMYDPKFGLTAKDRLERRQQEKNNSKKLAAHASALAEYYRGLSKLSDDKFLKERVALYEKEAKTFQNTATRLEVDWDFHRQHNSAKRNDAWPRRKFVQQVAMYMKAIFKKRYSKAVAVMTDIAFPAKKNHPTTANEVDDICRTRTR
jgi:hypothetical protein